MPIKRRSKSKPAAPLSPIVRALANSVDPDVQLDEAKVEHAVEDPTPEQIATTAERLKKEAARPLLAPKLRNLLTSLKSSYEQTIDSVSQDTLLHAGFSGDFARQSPRNSPIIPAIPRRE